MKKASLKYLSPDCEPLVAIRTDLLCESPADGGLEDVDYEDLVI